MLLMMPVPALSTRLPVTVGMTLKSGWHAQKEIEAQGISPAIPFTVDDGGILH